MQLLWYFPNKTKKETFWPGKRILGFVCTMWLRGICLSFLTCQRTWNCGKKKVKSTVNCTCISFICQRLNRHRYWGLMVFSVGVFVSHVNCALEIRLECLPSISNFFRKEDNFATKFSLCIKLRTLLARLRNNKKVFQWDVYCPLAHHVCYRSHQMSAPGRSSSEQV